VRTYNTVIGACARAGQPGAAAAVYRRMLGDGAAPTATTATALVSVFARAGQVGNSGLPLINCSFQAFWALLPPSLPCLSSARAGLVGDVEIDLGFRV